MSDTATGPMTGPMTLRQLLVTLALDFKIFEDPKSEARHLLFDAMDMDLSELLLRGDDQVPPEDFARVQRWKAERLKGIPLAYISGKKGFYKTEFIVRPGVLVPRPETELVVEMALARMNEAKSVADFGCGSGCIGLSLLQELPAAKLVSVDLSAVACEVTLANARNMDLAARTEVMNASVEEFAGDQSRVDEGFHLVVANPPYIAPGDTNVQKSVHDYEPHAALYAADEGLAALRSWTGVAMKVLKPRGVFVTEIGAGQSAAVQEIIREAGFQDIQVSRDLNNIERVISAMKPG